MDYSVFKDLAIIIVAAKLMGLFARKINVPQVVGEILAGLIIGPSVLGFVKQTDFLMQMAEIGVILLMFSAGLGTDLRSMVKTGPVACLIALAGVCVPLLCGTLLYMAFYGAAAIGSAEFFKAVFVGTILTATSVSITVKALSEMGKLKSEIGTMLVSAAIIDDVMGIIVLTVVIGLGTGTGGGGEVFSVILRTVLFFVFSLIVGFVIYKIFKKLDSRYKHTQRIPILGLALCMYLAYAAEHYFGVADITGAFVAGIILCNIKDANYIEEKMNINSYMLFGPVFFAGIGLKTDVSHLSAGIVLFSVCFVLVALLSKIIGCGAMARLCGYNARDSIKVGVGMMTRGEVALIVAQKGLGVKIIGADMFTPVILLIIVSSVLTPILLKLLYKNDGGVEKCQA